MIKVTGKIYQHHFVKVFILYSFLSSITLLQVLTGNNNPNAIFQSFYDGIYGVIMGCFYTILLPFVSVLWRGLFCKLFCKFFRKMRWTIWILSVLWLILFLLHMIDFGKTLFPSTQHIIIPNILLIPNSVWFFMWDLYYLLLLSSCSASMIFAPSRTGKIIFLTAIVSFIMMEILLIIDVANGLRFIILALLVLLVLFICFWPTKDKIAEKNK